MRVIALGVLLLVLAIVSPVIALTNQLTVTAVNKLKIVRPSETI